MSLVSLKFFFKKIKWSTCWGSRQDLVAVTMSPAVEKTRSEATELACAQRYTFTSLDNKGNFNWFVFQYCKGLALEGSLFSHLYMFISLSISSCFDRGGSTLEISMSSSSSIKKLRADFCLFGGGAGSCDSVFICGNSGKSGSFWTVGGCGRSGSGFTCTSWAVGKVISLPLSLSQAAPGALSFTRGSRTVASSRYSKRASLRYLLSRSFRIALLILVWNVLSVSWGEYSTFNFCSKGNISPSVGYWSAESASVAWYRGSIRCKNSSQCRTSSCPRRLHACRDFASCCFLMFSSVRVARTATCCFRNLSTIR